VILLLDYKLVRCCGTDVEDQGCLEGRAQLPEASTGGARTQHLNCWRWLARREPIEHERGRTCNGLSLVHSWAKVALASDGAPPQFAADSATMK
jgi:hypothetical protein